MSIGVNLPYASGPVDTSFGLGDVSLKFTHVPVVTPKYGLAYVLEAFFDTADRADIGSGQNSLKLSGFYARFLESGAIFAPALVHQETIGNPDPGRRDISVTTLDFYYVPKLANPKVYVTFDPAIVSDWENDLTYGSLTVTLGYLTGPALGGNGQVYVKPQVLGGGDRPLDSTIQVGYKVLGF